MLINLINFFHLGSMRSNKGFRTTINQQPQSDNVPPPAPAKEINTTNSRSNLPMSQVHTYACTLEFKLIDLDLI